MRSDDPGAGPDTHTHMGRTGDANQILARALGPSRSAQPGQTGETSFALDLGGGDWAGEADLLPILVLGGEALGALAFA